MTQEQREHCESWVEALRSGEYDQTCEQLRTEGGFCCLGVACDISRLSEWKKIKGFFEYDHSINVPPYTVQKWAGLTDPDIHHLIHMNDTGKTFYDIADYIEKEIL